MLEPFCSGNTANDNPDKITRLILFWVAYYMSLDLKMLLFSPSSGGLMQVMVSKPSCFTAGCQTHSFHIQQHCHSMQHNKKTDRLKMNGLIFYTETAVCNPCLFFFLFFLDKVLSCSLWLLCYFGQQMDQQGMRGQSPQISYYYTVCSDYSIWKPSRDQAMAH